MQYGKVQSKIILLLVIFFFWSVNSIIQKIHADFLLGKKDCYQREAEQELKDVFKKKNIKIDMCRKSPVTVSVFKMWFPTVVRLLGIFMKFFWFKHGTDHSGRVKGEHPTAGCFLRLWYSVGFQLKSASL